MEECDSACYSTNDTSKLSRDIDHYQIVYNRSLLNRAYHNDQMISYQARLDSFTDWFHWQKPTKEELAKSGFYYVGISDKVKCFDCGVGLCNWRKEDSAYYEHRLYSTRCSFVQSTQPF